MTAIDPAQRLLVVCAPFTDNPQKYLVLETSIKATNDQIDTAITAALAERSGCATQDGSLVRSMRVYGATTAQEAANTAKTAGLRAESPAVLQAKKDEGLPGTGPVNDLKVAYRAWPTAPYRIIDVSAQATDDEIHLHIARTERTRPGTVAFLRAPGAADANAVRQQVIARQFDYMPPEHIEAVRAELKTKSMKDIVEGYPLWKILHGKGEVNRQAQAALFKEIFGNKPFF